MNTIIATCLLAVISGVTNDWENLEVNSIDRLPPRTYTMPLASEVSALSDALDPETPYRISLNGEWKISWAGNPALRVKDFYKVGFNDADWFKIGVPSCVEMRGFGNPGYTNQKYPHKMEWPFIKDRQSGKSDYNPVSSYRRTFTVPKEWANRRVILRFDGVYSAYYVWVNGVKVGYAEDSKLPSEFDITAYLNSSSAENLLAVEVYRWCDGSYLEDQDMTRFSGIFRDVTLWSMPENGIWDFTVKTKFFVGYGAAMLSVEGIDGEWHGALYDAERRKVGELSNGLSRVHVPNVQLWSAEKPYLYTLVLRKGSDIRRRRVGFKEQKIVGNMVLVNGRPVKFKGVNRHETNPDNGRTVSMNDMIRDITLMKRYNINTVRTSHYPNHHLWYDLCDKYGIYLCAEANVEGHEPAYDEKGLGRFKEWNHSIVERNERHVKFYRNHPSITMWSMGNETGHGDCFRNAIAAVKKIDPSRPVHWERGNPDADIDSCMYPSVEWLDERGRLGDGDDTVKTSEDKYRRNENRQSRNKAFFICEYAHAMGNAIGNLEEYWETMYKYNSLSGGCIWDWIDQAVWKYTNKVGPDGRRERFLSYGGDFDEFPNDGPFNCNGVIDPERNVTAKLIEVGQVYRNLVVSKNQEGQVELWNRSCFTSADEFDGEWELVSNGKISERGSFTVPAIAPLGKGVIDSLPKFKLAEDCEVFLNVNFRLRKNEGWADKGWIISRNQIKLNDGCKAKEMECVVPEIVEGKRSISVLCGGTRAVFSRASGTLRELEMNGVSIIKDPLPGLTCGPMLTCARAFVDNDRWIGGDPSQWDRPGPFIASGLSQLNYHVRPIKVKDGVIEIITEVTGSKSAGFTHKATWTFAADGSIEVKNSVTPFGTMPMALPRLGLSMKLDAALEHVRYYGRGPFENYIDRCTGSLIGIYDSTVTEQFENYVRPQDNGYKCDVRWIELADVRGRGIRFSASEPMFVQALHYAIEDLDIARPKRGQPRFRVPLVPRKEVCLNLDVRQLGLGGRSCGPIPMKKYIFPIEKTEWTLRLSPLR